MIRSRFRGGTGLHVGEAMHCVIPDRLWVGHAGDRTNVRAIHDAGIRAVVDLAHEESPAIPPRDLIWERIPLGDGEGNETALLEIAVETVVTLLCRSLPTLVVCGAGLSQTPAIAAAAISVIEQCPPDDALARIAASVGAEVSPALWREVKGVLP